MRIEDRIDAWLCSVFISFFRAMIHASWIASLLLMRSAGLFTAVAFWLIERKGAIDVLCLRAILWLDPDYFRKMVDHQDEADSTN